MFDLANWQNPGTLLLNITNGLLGLVTVGLIVWICGAAIYEHIAIHQKTDIKN